jgi:hypothetical protein
MTIYNMPIWLRNATYNFIIESVKTENDANNKAINQSTGNKTKLDMANPTAAKNQLPQQYIKASKK